MNTGSDFPETKRNDQILYQKELKIEVNDIWQIQRCSRILYPLFPGLTGNTNGHFTPVVALIHSAIHKLPVETAEKMSLFICHKIFSLAHNWSKRIKGLHMSLLRSQLKLESNREIFPNFKMAHVPQNSQFFSSYSLRNCSLLGADDVSWQFSPK